jgi:hypothetical protein
MSADDVRNELTEEVERGQRCAFSPVDLSIDYDLIVAARDRIVELEEKIEDLDEDVRLLKKALDHIAPQPDEDLRRELEALGVDIEEARVKFYKETLPMVKEKDIAPLQRMMRDD